MGYSGEPIKVVAISNDQDELRKIEYEYRTGSSGATSGIRQVTQEEIDRGDIVVGQVRGYNTSRADQAKPQSQSQVVVDVVTGKNIPYGESAQSKSKVQVGNIEVQLPSGLSQQDIYNINKAVESGQIRQPQQVLDVANTLISSRQTSKERLSGMILDTGETFGEFAARAGEEAKESLLMKQSILAQTGRTPRQLGEATALRLYEKQALFAETGKTPEQFSVGIQRDIKAKQDTLFPERFFAEDIRSIAKIFKPPVKSPSFIKDSALVKSAQKASEFSVLGLSNKAESKIGKFISEQPITIVTKESLKKGINQSAILGTDSLSLGGQSKAVLEFGLGTIEGFEKVPIKQSIFAYLGGRILGKGEQIFTKARGSIALLKTAQYALAGSFILGIKAKAKAEGISPARELGREGLSLVAFGKGYKTQITINDLKAPRPYYITKKPIEVDITDDGLNIKYTTILREPKYYKTTKLIDFGEYSKVEAKYFDISNIGKDVMQVKTETKVYVLPRKAKRFIPVAIKEEGIAYRGKVDVAGKSYPVFEKVDYGKGLGILDIKSKEGSKLKIRLFKQEPIREQRIGSARQKLETYEFKPEFTYKITADKGKEYNIFDFVEKKSSGQLVKRQRLLSTSMIKGIPIALPKLTKIVGAEKSSKPKKIIDFRVLVQEQIQKTETKPRSQKVVIENKEIKPTSGAFNIPISPSSIREYNEQESYDYPVVSIEEIFAPISASRPLIKINQISEPKAVSIPFISQLQKSNQLPESMQSLIPKTAQIPRIDTKPLIDVKPIQKQGQIIEARQIPIFEQQFKFRNTPPTRILPPPPTRILPPLTSSSRKMFGKPLKNINNLFNPFKTKYKPSVVGIALNIRGKKPKILTGLEIRPILYTTRRKRKK